MNNINGLSEIQLKIVRVVGYHASNPEMQIVGTMSRTRFTALGNELLSKIPNQWPLVVVGFGLLLTIAWLVLLVWLPLHMLNLV
jgi:hypothetical protein